MTLDKKAPSFKVGQKLNTAPRIPKGVRWTVKSFATTSQSSLNLTNLIAADHDAVGYPCKRLVPAMCSLLHNYSYRDFHSHQDLWSCTLSPHSCVVQRVCRPDDRITFDTQTADECPGHDTHPPTRARSLLGDVNPKLVHIRFGAHAPPPQPDRE